MLLIKKMFWLVQYATGYDPGPVAPTGTDGASLIFSAKFMPIKAWFVPGCAVKHLLLENQKCYTTKWDLIRDTFAVQLTS